MLTEEKCRINKHISVFNQSMLEQDINEMSIGLYYGRMGLCIYFYHQYRYSKNKAYEQFAEKLLDSVCDSITQESSIDFETGLTGICWGIIYLIEHKFIEGNPNSILKEYDNKILRNFPTKYLKDDSVNAKSILRILSYFCKRLENNKLSADERYLFENYTIKGLNAIDATFSNEKFQEIHFFSFFDYFTPLYLELLSRLYQMNFYNYKIDKILEKLSLGIRTTLPLLGSNRLYLCCEMEKISKLKKIEGWNEHISILKQTINYEKIISEEFRNKNMLLGNGLAGFYYLLRLFDLNSDKIDSLILSKIMNSELWLDIGQPQMLKRQQGLMNGMSGLILVTQNIIEIKNK